MLDIIDWFHAINMGYLGVEGSLNLSEVFLFMADLFDTLLLYLLFSLHSCSLTQSVLSEFIRYIFS